MTKLTKLMLELKGEKNIETVCDDCNLSRQTFLLLRRHGRVKLSTIVRLLDYFKASRVKRAEIVRAWIIAQIGPKLSRDLQIKIRTKKRLQPGGPAVFTLI